MLQYNRSMTINLPSDFKIPTPQTENKKLFNYYADDEKLWIRNTLTICFHEKIHRADTITECFFMLFGLVMTLFTEEKIIK